MNVRTRFFLVKVAEISLKDRIGVPHRQGITFEIIFVIERSETFKLIILVNSELGNH